MIPASSMAAVRRDIREHTGETQTEGGYNNRQVDKYQDGRIQRRDRYTQEATNVVRVLSESPRAESHMTKRGDS